MAAAEYHGRWRVTWWRFALFGQFPRVVAALALLCSALLSSALLSSAQLMPLLLLQKAFVPACDASDPEVEEME